MQDINYHESNNSKLHERQDLQIKKIMCERRVLRAGPIHFLLA